MKKSLLAVLFCLCLIVLLPMAPAEAETAYDLYVGGIQVTSENMNNITGARIDIGKDGYVRYDPDTNTLFLHNAEVGGRLVDAIDEERSFGVYAGDGLTNLNIETDGVVLLKGTNKGSFTCGLYAECPVKIVNSGTLTVRGYHNSDYSGIHSYGIYCSDTLSIINNNEFTASGRKGPNISYGIFAGGDVSFSGTGTSYVNGRNGIVTSGNVSVNSGKVNVELTFPQNKEIKLQDTKGIECKELSVQANAKLNVEYSGTNNYYNTAKKGYYYNYASTGVKCETIKVLGEAVIINPDISLSCSNESPEAPCVYKMGSSADNACYMLFDYASNWSYVEIKPGTYYKDLRLADVCVCVYNKDDITGLDIVGKAEYDPDTKTLTLTNADVIQKMRNNDTDEQFGIELPAGATLKCMGTSNTLRGRGFAGIYSQPVYGIYGKGDLTIEYEGVLNANCGSKNYKYGYGIYALGDIILRGENGEVITAKGTIAGIYSDQGSITIENGSINALPMTEKLKYGVYCKNLTVGEKAFLTADASSVTDEEAIAEHEASVYCNGMLNVKGSLTAVSPKQAVKFGAGGAFQEDSGFSYACWAGDSKDTAVSIAPSALGNQKYIQILTPMKTTISGSYTVSTTNPETFVYTVDSVEGAEYSMDNGERVTSPVFDQIDPNSTHSFQRYISPSGQDGHGELGRTGDVVFSKLNNPNIPLLQYSESGDFGRKTITITPVAGAEYSFDGGITWGSNNTKPNISEQFITICIRYMETAVCNASPFDSALVDISRKAQELRFYVLSESKTYGYGDFTIPAKHTKGDGALTYSSSDTSVAQVDSSTGTVHILKPGTVLITATAARTEEYEEAKAAYTLTIAPAKLTIRAEDKEIAFGESEPVYTATAIGLVPGDTISDITYRADIDNTSRRGKFAITPQGGSISSGNDNYDIDYQNGTLTITMDVSPIDEALGKATEAMSGVEAYDKPAEQVPDGVEFVSTDDWNALNESIMYVFGEKERVATPEEMQQVIDDLLYDVDIFLGKIDIGTLPSYTVSLTASPERAGWLEGDGSYYEGEDVTVTADAYPGYIFVKWTENGSDISDQESFTINNLSEDRNLVAEFKKDPTTTFYTVTVINNNPEWGTVTGAGDYPEGNSALIKTVLKPGYCVEKWILDGTEIPNQYGWDEYTIENIHEAHTIEVVLYPTAPPTSGIYNITVISEPTEGGTANSPFSVAAPGTTVSLYADPSEGYILKGWQTTPSTVAIGEDKTFTMPNENVTITAIFEKVKYSITVKVSPEEGGSASADLYEAAENTTVTLSAVPSEGYVFKDWKIVPATATIDDEDTLIMPNSDVSVTALFDKLPTPTPTITGVSVTPDTVSVEKGKTHKFTAAVSGMGSYDSTVVWSVEGALSSDTTIDQTGLLSVADDESASTLTIIATANGDNTKSGTATVQVIPPEPVITYYDDPVVQGKMGLFISNAEFDLLENVFLDDLLITLNKDYTAKSGSTEITLLGSFTSGLSLGEHSIAIVSSTGAAMTDFTVVPPTSTAHNVSVSVSPAGSGTASASSIFASAGETVTLSATPSGGHYFKEWQVTPSTVSIGTDNTFTMPNEDVSIVAVFDKEAVPGNPLTIIRHPEDQFVVEGQQAIFSVSVSGGTLPYSYQWYINRNDGAGWQEISGATDASYTTSVTKLSNNGYKYYCIVSDADDQQLKSNEATLFVSKYVALPQTGDNAKPLLWLGLMFAGIAGIVTLTLRGKKKAY